MYYNSMREVLNISLPKFIYESVEREVEKGGFASKSEFFRHLFRLWQEDKILKEVSTSRKEIASGKGKKLTSLKSLR